MIVVGYEQNSGLDVEPKIITLSEVSFQLTLAELSQIADFIIDATSELREYGFPHGACTIQFRDWCNEWKDGVPDVVLVIEPPKM